MQVNPARVEQIFSETLDKPSPTARAEFLAQACGQDQELRQQVDALLAAHDAAGSFLKLSEADQTLDPTVRLSEGAGSKIGRYKLLQQIGEGGFGVVFMAEQEQPVRRLVALKIIKLGMDTRQVVARFEAERQALAMMDHPNVAKVLDGGATETGRPYFVMELVKGTPITEYCDKNNLSIPRRLDLFAQVCQAVQHAHQKGLIHRDIKPSNVLVATADDRPVAKVIDFGIAKAMQSRLTEKTLFTEFRQLIGTPEYMSPEQAEGGLDIDTRSDVYSLGVLLYELLAGSPPFDGKELRSKAFEEMKRIIREVEPPTPSTRLSGLTDTLPSIAAQRNIEPRKLAALVRGELDWIVMRCLEKDRKRRYQTANDLAQDIGRYLSDQPVEARPVSRSYRLKKFIRRNKGGVVAGSAIAAALILGLALASIGFIQARRQEQIARTEAARSEQVARFLKDTLRAAGPSVARGRDATLLREILDKTATRVEKELKDQPEVQGDLWYTLGATYHDIDDRLQATACYQHAVDSYRLVFRNPNIKLAKALGAMGAMQSRNRNVTSGRNNAQLGLEMARKCGDRETLARCLLDMASSLDEGTMAATDPYAASLLREAVALWKELGTDPQALAMCMTRLGDCLDEDEDESLKREALALVRKQLGPDHPCAIDIQSRHGQMLMKRGKLAEAEAAFREAVDLEHKVFDRKHMLVMLDVRLLAQTLALEGRWDEAETVIRQELAALPSDANRWHILGKFNAYRGHWSEAIEQMSRAYEIEPGENTSRNLTIALMRTGRIEEYRRYCHKHLERFGNSGELSYSARAATISLLLPMDGADFEQACKLADFAATQSEPKRFVPWGNLSKALADYRRGWFESAGDWGNRAASSDYRYYDSCKAAGTFVQAMARARLRQMELARAAFAHGNDILHRPRAEISEEFGGGWNNWTVAEILGRQAAELLGMPPPSTGPATRP